MDAFQRLNSSSSPNEMLTSASVTACRLGLPKPLPMSMKQEPGPRLQRDFKQSNTRWKLAAVTSP